LISPASTDNILTTIIVRLFIPNQIALRLGLPNLVKSKSGNKSSIIAKRIAKRRFTVVEPLLSGIVLGLIVVTLAGLFYAAYRQYKRPNQLGG
jgi:hypothetical protein